jgi:hypothetical protein
MVCDGITEGYSKTLHPDDIFNANHYQQYLELFVTTPAVTRSQEFHPRNADRRQATLRWLRQAHGWIGLWGALLGLLFGISGFLLNHRNQLKLPLPKSPETTVQYPLSMPLPVDTDTLLQVLAKDLGLDAVPYKIKAEPAREVVWGAQTLQQPARWQITFAAPDETTTVDYWAGNATAEIKRSEHNAFAFISNLHKGSGMGIGWILLVDTLAGSIILLSISGLLMWTQLRRRRLLALGVFGSSTALAIGLVAGAI